MDDSYFYQPSNPGPTRAVKWLLLLLLLRVKKPISWSVFLSLNSTIRSLLKEWIRPKHKDPETVDRRVRKLSNLLSVGFLYSAVSSNVRIPKDYLLLYIFMTYYGELNPPSSNIVVSPSTTRYFKLSSYKKDLWVRRLYEKKHFFIYLFLFGQLLSNYLTPTKYKLNQKYLSSSIKSQIFNPIWINFSMGVNSQTLNWLGLLKAYVKHNAMLIGIFGLTEFKLRFIAHYIELQHDAYRGTGGLKEIVRNYVAYVLNKANEIANFIYGPNILSMFLLALTAPMLTKYPALRRAYLSDVKLFIKNYIKAIGFVAAFATMAANSMDFIPSFGYRRIKGDDGPSNIRRLPSSFMDALNIYLFRLIVLSKWRIVKENHPWFTILKIGSWERIESLIMCYGVWKLMNLNDYVTKHRSGPHAEECSRIALVPMMRGIDRLMS
ncbi:CIC11C00000005048 [Sungouiella intermedia]|uniref:CIC11C00000005048 n=1 Tax=Sungouiella intermedia TaxID=45354 RepID=A0A1L0BEM5_9ASCO|nr:CIC11C00000005048 [[Candida] intermedia]